MSRPTIIYVHDLSGSGVVVAALAFARWLAERRETILAAGYDQGLFRGADAGKARLVTLLDRPGRNRRWDAAVALRRLVRESGAEAIVSMGNLGHRSVLWGTAGLRLKRIFLISNDVSRKKKFVVKRWMQAARRRWMVRAADRLVPVGQGFMDAPWLARAQALGKVAIIPNGVDVDRARELAGAPCPHPWLEDGGDPVVIAVGRIRPQKNHAALVEAVRLANRERPCRLILLGDGPDEDVTALRERIAASGLEGRVLLAGTTDNVFAWVARSALFALPSNWEGSSIALLEAMAVGTPVLASRQAGDAAQVLEEGRWGVLVDARDVSSIARGIVRQLDDPVRPDRRAEDFSLERTHRSYLRQLEG